MTLYAIKDAIIQNQQFSYFYQNTAPEKMLDFCFYMTKNEKDKKKKCVRYSDQKWQFSYGFWIESDKLKQGVRLSAPFLVYVLYIHTRNLILLMTCNGCDKPLGHVF